MIDDGCTLKGEEAAEEVQTATKACMQRFFPGFVTMHRSVETSEGEPTKKVVRA